MKLDKWHDLREKAAALSLRERGILTGTVVVLVLFVWLQFVFTPYEKQQTNNERKILQLNQDLSRYSERLVDLNDKLANDPNAPLRAEQKELKFQLEDLREQIEGRLSNLIAPEQMADVMRKVLSDYSGLKLLSARNLPVEPLQIETGSSEKPDAKQSDKSGQAVIFTHGFEMVLSGRYFQALEFLQRLENMSGFYWRLLDYEVQVYPNAKITLQLSTLSLDEDWIGV